jgi:hypothetical protein
LLYTFTKSADDLTAETHYMNIAAPIENGDNILTLKKPFTITCGGSPADCSNCPLEIYYYAVNSGSTDLSNTPSVVMGSQIYEDSNGDLQIAFDVSTERN